MTGTSFDPDESRPSLPSRRSFLSCIASHPETFRHHLSFSCVHSESMSQALMSHLKYYFHATFRRRLQPSWVRPRRPKQGTETDRLAWKCRKKSFWRPRKHLRHIARRCFCIDPSSEGRIFLRSAGRSFSFLSWIAPSGFELDRAQVERVAVPSAAHERSSLDRAVRASKKERK